MAGGLKVEAKRYNYASFVLNRRPRFKVHSTMGPAKNAIQSHGPGGGIILELNDGEWVPIHQWYAPKTCDKCGSGAHYDEYSGGYTWRSKLNRVFPKNTSVEYGAHNYQYWCWDCLEKRNYDPNEVILPIDRDYWVVSPEKQEELVKFIEDNW